MEQLIPSPAPFASFPLVNIVLFLVLMLTYVPF